MNASKISRRSFGALSVAGLATGAGLPTLASAQSGTNLDTIKSRGVIRIGWAVWVPYMYLDPASRERVGITMSLTQAIAEKLGVRAEYVETTWATMVAGLQANQYDMTMPLGISEERARAVTFTEPVVYQNWGLTVHKDKVGNYKSWQDLNKPGMRISASMGSTGVKFLQALDQATPSLVKDGSESISQILTGQADAWMAPYDTSRVAQQKQPALVLVPGPPIAKEGVALSVRKNEMALKAKLDEIVGELRRNGQLLAMIKKFGLDETSLG